MASSSSAIAVLTISLVIATATATEHWVGGSAGWTLSFDYKAWAANTIFRVGDTLVFNYTQGKHNVYKVDAAGFKDCLVPAAAKPFDSGHDVIPLNTSGRKWYICGFDKHCSDYNQKLVIDVEAVDAAPSPAPSSNSAPTTNNLFYSLILGAAAPLVVALGLMMI